MDGDWRSISRGKTFMDGGKTMDRGEYRRASHAVWEAMAPGWDERHAFFEESMRPVTERMLELVGASPNAAILELAAGTGVVGFSAARLVGPGGRVILSDFSTAMVEIASRRASELGLANVDCRVLDAERLDLPDASVDGVLCRLGYMLVADPAAAFRETRRVLSTGGRVAFAVLASPEQNPWGVLPARVLQQRGHMEPPEPGAPGLFALADPDRLHSLLTECGFSDPVIEQMSFTFPFAGMDDYWGYIKDAAGAIALVLNRLGDEEQQRVRDETAAQLDPYYTSGRIELPAGVLVVSMGV